MIETFLKELDDKIQDKHLLNHPFYLAWSRGELSLEILKEYALDYYTHVKAFPRYLSALHSRVEDQETRRHLLTNLIEEEAGSPNHPELWKSFAIHLGAPEEEIDNHKTSSAMNELVSHFMHVCQNESIPSAIASLYAYESQIPAVSESKIDGLKKHYGMESPKSWHYFTVHIEADKEHAAVERALLKKHVTEDDKLEVATNVDKTLDKLNNFLTSLCERYQICQMA